MVMTQGLLISVIGMGLVFLMIVALWGIMAGMVAIFKERTKPGTAEDVVEEVAEAETQPELLVNASQAELVAAVAVSYALACQSSAPNTSISGSTCWNPSTRAYSPFRQHKGW
jgi:Na+-transporting methylmalonyl-CoA/oxaloacetate decarboxylase gamma subunit